MRERPRKIFDWPAMQAYIDAGNGFLKCRQRFGIAHATWMAAIGRGAIAFNRAGRPYAGPGKRYNWAEIRAFYEAGATFRQCRVRFGFCAASWTKAVKAGRVVPKPTGYSLVEALANSSSRLTIKRHLLKAGIITNRCDWCGLADWRGQPLSIQIDHINGIRNDHRVENLRMLCPNCHSQTATFAARNRRARRVS
jgi:hypothetical protein